MLHDSRMAQSSLKECLRSSDSSSSYSSIRVPPSILKRAFSIQLYRGHYVRDQADVPRDTD